MYLERDRAFNMLSFSPLSFNDRERYEEHYRACQVKSSSYSFFALFGWNDTYPLELAWSDNLCWLRCSENKKQFLAPIGDWTSVNWRSVLGQYFVKGDVWLNVPERLIEFFTDKGLSEDSFQIVLKDSRDDWEYLYNIPDLITLKGHKYVRIRNQINKFFSSYSWDYQPATPSYFPDILRIQDKWIQEHGIHTWDSSALEAENKAVQKALEYWDKFPFIGGILRADGEIIGYTISEVLDEKTIDTRFEKTIIGYSGRYQSLQYLFLKEQSMNYDLINREEDLGILGLRESKMLYRPSAFIKKYNVEFQ